VRRNFSSGAKLVGTPCRNLVPLVQVAKDLDQVSGGGACAGDTRVIMEGTLGFWHKFYQGPKGGMRWGIQYSYFTKTGWSGVVSSTNAAQVQPKAVENMVLAFFRYYLP
jgi:hypothetical protein